MKRIVFFAFALLIAVCLCSCKKENARKSVDVCGKYLVLNNGAWNKNNASVSLYDPESGIVEPNAFQRANGRKLGDLAQDILYHDGNFYITASGSCHIWKTDLNLNVTEEWATKEAGSPISPRCLTLCDNEIFATFHEGYLKSLNDLESNAKISSMALPEGITSQGNVMYVAESDGYGDGCRQSKLGVVTKTGKTLSYTSVEGLNYNLQSLAVSGNRLYALSWDVYDADFNVMSTAKLQCLELTTMDIADYDLKNPNVMAEDGNGKLFVLCFDGYNEDLQCTSGSVYCVDMADAAIIGEPVITGITNPYSISADSEAIYIGTSDYVNTGNVMIYSHNGTLLHSFDCGGINPQKVLYVR